MVDHFGGAKGVANDEDARTGRVAVIAPNGFMEAVGGDTSRHDHEFDEVAWMPLDEAYRVVNYENQRQVLGEAANALGVDL